jgi:cytochrome c oxidase assembly protein subunit 15
MASNASSIVRHGIHRNFHRLAWLAVVLALGVIVFGSFVRLSNAGLSCPDWPTCYGRAAWPQHSNEAVDHAATAIRAVEPHKAWREQLHRMLAASLGLVVLALALLAARRRRYGIAQVLCAAVLVGIGIPLYMHGQHVAASVFAIAGEALLLFAALRWSNVDLARTAALTLMVIIFQALLGMWTVTWLLKPLVVTAHLLGGLGTFALLTWLAFASTSNRMLVQAVAPKLRRLLWIGVGLLAVQIALGGWTSANYAALACANDFPKCVGQWWPPTNFREAFVLWRGIGVDYEGGVLDGQSRIAIQMAHRIMAGIVFVYLAILSVRLVRIPGMLAWGVTLGALLLTQVALGIANVKLGLPLHVAVAHNAGAALLLFVLVTLVARVRTPEV